MGYLAAKQRKFLEHARSAKCLLAAAAHVKEAVFVLVRVINTSFVVGSSQYAFLCLLL
jgi:hypothetical protein